MSFWKLIRRSLRFHARSHLGVVLGAAIGSAVLIGALVVGDSVKESLRERALNQLGEIGCAISSSDNFFSDDLGSIFHDAYPIWWNSNTLSVSGFASSPAVALSLPATAIRQDSSARANHINLLAFAKPDVARTNLAFLPFVRLRSHNSASNVKPGEVFLNESLAVILHINVGDQIILRVSKPSAFSQETPLSSRANSVIAFRLCVAKILTSSRWGDLNIRPASVAPLNAFMNVEQLQHETGLENRANLFLYGNAISTKETLLGRLWQNGPVSLWTRFPGLFATVDDVSGDELAKQLDENLKQVFRLVDVGVQVSAASNSLTLTSHRIFLPLPLERAALTSDTNAQPVLTYLANLLQVGTNSTPYSMVTAAGAPWTPADMRDDEIILNQWLADDLQVKPGDEIAMSYFLPESGAKLIEATNTFRVRSIVPMEMPWADRTLMPDFPGIEKAESTSDWDAGFPLVHKIRPKDEDYWKKYRGTPKAFVTLAAGKKMWANRFGELTAIRFPVPTNSVGDEVTRLTSSVTSSSQTNQLESPYVVSYKEALEKKILASLKPEELGLRFEPVREQALKAAEQSQDFGQLFLGFSFFIIVAALVLMALLFQFGLEQRTTEIGTLLALGFTQQQVRRLLLREGIVLALIGGAIGAVGGVFYAKAMLHGLTTVWRDAVGMSSLQFHASPKTLVIGFLASTVVATFTIWLTLRKQAKRPARELLVDEFQVSGFKFQVGKRGVAQLIGAGAALAAVVLVGWAISKSETKNAEIFFSAGALVLIAGLAFAAAWLRQLSEGGVLRRPNIKSEKSQGVVERRPPKENLTLASLAARGISRRRKRTLATIAMLACGSFLIVAISAFRLDSNQNATKRSSGTGGFALIGETTMPVVHDLNSKSGRDFFVLNEREFADVSFVPFRVHEGDEASCLNLNRAQKPRLLGVKPESLGGRFAFAKGARWNLLRSSRRKEALTKSEIDQSLLTSAATNSDEIPAIGDANSIQWALHKKVGDTIDYTDERGNVFKLRLVGAVANSILQGSLIVDEAEFVKRFPSESGYKMFLIDAPTNRVAEISATLSRAMEDVGLELTPATRRLNEFNAVQNTYLGTFQILGGLGLLLGSAGLGIVVLRNVLERRGELGLLVAVGFRKRALQWMLLTEHGALLGVGLGIGLLAAVVAILPSLISPSAEIPFASVAITLGAVLLNGALWTWIATRIAVRGNLLAALRNE